MALDKNLEALVSLIEEPDQQTGLRQILEKSDKLQKELSEGILRQSDYDRKMNSLKTEMATERQKLDDSVSQYKDLHQQNVKWREDNLARFNRLEAENKAANEKLKALSEGKEIPEGDQVTKAEVDARVAEVLKNTGVLSNDQIKGVVDTQVGTVVEQMKKEFYSNDLPAATQFQMDMVDTAFDHQREYGKPLDRDALATYMKEHKLANPKKAYEEMFKEERDKKRIADEVAKAKVEQEKELRDKFSKESVPGSDGGSEVGAIQARQVRDAAAQKTGGGAAAAAAELRTEGKV